jgi:hypothetical protein
VNLRKIIGRIGLAALASAAIPATACAQNRPPIVARAEQCLRKNVDRVVASERDLQSAAAFLVTYACADEISGAARYGRNSAYVQMFGTIFKMVGQSNAAAATASGKPAPILPDFKASVDPDTGDIVLPPPAPGAPTTPIATLLPTMEGLFGQVAPEAVPVNIRKLAGEIVLDAHERITAKGR